MIEWIRYRCRWFEAFVGVMLVCAIVAPAALADPVFSIAPGPTLPGPAMADPGPYAPQGFANVDGSNSAFTGYGYFNGTTWVNFPNGFHAVVNASDPVWPLSGDADTWAMAINGLGHMVGNSNTSSLNSWVAIWQTTPATDHAIYYSIQSGTVALQTLNGAAGLPMGINNLDQIVGESYTSSGAIHGFITTPGGAAFDLNSLISAGSGYTILAGTAINDQGTITAIALGPDGLDHELFLTPIIPLSTFLAPGTSPSLPVNESPVPEPGPIYLLGLVGAHFASRRLSRAIRKQARVGSS